MSQEEDTLFQNDNESTNLEAELETKEIETVAKQLFQLKHRCFNCFVESTPQWRYKNILQQNVLLCNACGIKCMNLLICTDCGRIPTSIQEKINDFEIMAKRYRTNLPRLRHFNNDFCKEMRRKNCLYLELYKS